MLNTKNIEKMSILVFAYEGYSDLWHIFFALLSRNWSDNPFKTYFSSPYNNDINYNIKFINTESRKSWSERLYETLKSVSEEYVLVLLEDYFITSKVNTKNMQEVIKVIRQNDIKYYKFFVPTFSIKYSSKMNYKDTCYYIDSNRKYGISFQPAIWNTKYLMSLVKDLNINAWELEKQLDNSNLIDDSKLGFHIFDSRNLLNIEHALIKGRYTRKAFNIIKKEKLLQHINKRNKMSILSSFFMRIKHYIRNIIPGLTRKNTIK